MRLVITFFLLTLLPHSVLGQQDYLWPTSSSRSLSATFGETRAAHFHAGLDIKTWGREGYRVFATKDATLYRIGISANGYGKVIYLKHDDGGYSIYAHLQAFNDSIQHLADSLRLIDYSFEIDQNVEAYGIKVKQGDVIGYTGSTGIGPPHLHFELRDEHMRPFNALETNLKVKDELPPVFSSLLIEPSSPHALIEGQKVATVIRPKKNAEGYYDYGSITVQGLIQLSVDVYDEANDVPNKYAAYELSLIQNTDTLFHSMLSNYDYEHASDMFLDRAIDPSTGRRRFQRLYIPDGAQVPFYDRRFIKPIDSYYPQTLTIVAKDIYGNSSIAQIDLVAPEAYTPILETSFTNTSIEQIQNWTWSNDWVSPDSTTFIDLQKEMGTPFTSSIFHGAKPKSRLIRNNNYQTLYLARLKPGISHSLFSQDRKFRINFPKNTFFDPLTTVIPFSSTTNTSNTIQLFPQDYISKHMFRVQYYIDSNEAYNEQLALYKFNRFKNEWNFTQSERIGNTLYAWNNEFGTYAALPDTLAPVIGEAVAERNETGSWLVKVSVIDDLSGIAYRRSRIFVNNQRGIAEYDKEDDVLIYYLPNFEPNDTNTVSVEVFDRVGNVTSKQMEIKKAE